ncbi:MAG TPA: hypothetical protein VFO58_03395 [Vicinamibacterales bacterium]|nr:hypothetical protein [Vicinamibacterales bacterium]
MCWRHRIAVVLLTVLAGVPVSGTVCVMVCESASGAAAGHHGSGQTCEEPSLPSTGPHLSGPSQHDCRAHAGVIPQAATTAAERADTIAKSPLQVLGAVPVRPVTLRDSGTFDDTSPPGTTPLTTTPLVLRV